MCVETQDKNGNWIPATPKPLRYKIKHGSITLDFLTPQQDRVTYWFDDGFIECEKNCVWYISLSGEKKMTISTIGLIYIYLRDGFLEEVKEV